MGEYSPMLWAEYFNASFDSNYPGTSVVRTYIYQLYDHVTDTSPQANFGMIETDFRRKANYRSLENMLDIVADPAANVGTFAPGSLGYEITGESAGAHHPAPKGEREVLPTDVARGQALRLARRLGAVHQGCCGERHHRLPGYSRCEGLLSGRHSLE